MAKLLIQAILSASFTIFTVYAHEMTSCIYRDVQTLTATTLSGDTGQIIFNFSGNALDSNQECCGKYVFDSNQVKSGQIFKFTLPELPNLGGYCTTSTDFLHIKAKAVTGFNSQNIIQKANDCSYYPAFASTKTVGWTSQPGDTIFVTFCATKEPSNVDYKAVTIQYDATETEICSFRDNSSSIRTLGFSGISDSILFLLEEDDLDLTKECCVKYLYDENSISGGEIFSFTINDEPALQNHCTSNTDFIHIKAKRPSTGLSKNILRKKSSCSAYVGTFSSLDVGWSTQPGDQISVMFCATKTNIDAFKGAFIQYTVGNENTGPVTQPPGTEN